MNDPLTSQLVRKLEEENDMLRERVRQLEAQIGSETAQPIPMEWGLTDREERLIRALIGREEASKEYLMSYVYADRIDAAPEVKIIDVFVCKIRRKLKPFGVGITTIWGRGFRLDAETRARFGKKPTGVEHAGADLAHV